MLLNKLEFALMHNPIRHFLQSALEIKNFTRLVSLPAGATVLEIGCGDGHGTKLIEKHFKPAKIYAIDLDSKMIALAKKGSNSAAVSFEVGDASKLQYSDNSFDAIFDFGIIHHIPNWKDCILELKRVLKPNGVILIEDLSIETFKNSVGIIFKKVLSHPYNHMYKREEFFKYAEEVGLKIQSKEVHNPLGLLQYFVVIARK